MTDQPITDPELRDQLRSVINALSASEVELVALRASIRNIIADMHGTTGARHWIAALDSALDSAREQPWPADTDTARWLHVTITNPDPHTTNRAALSVRDWLTAEFPSIRMRIDTNAHEWDG